MAYHIDQANGDVVINGWENGIADAPEKGIALIRNINLVSIPGEALVNYATEALVTPTTQLTSVACTTTASTNAVTWTGLGSLLTSKTAITFGSTAGGVTAGIVYWVNTVVDGSPNSFKVYSNISGNTVVTLSDGSNTFSVVQFGQPTHKALDFANNRVFILDANGRAWFINSAIALQYIGNTTLTNSHGNGICVLGDFLFVYRDTAIDYMPLSDITGSAAPTWTYAWNSYAIVSYPATSYSHFAYTSNIDGAMYFCNGRFIGRVAPFGSGSFDPATPSTYQITLLAPSVGLPTTDGATCLADLGNNILIGGIQNRVYSWNRLDAYLNTPLILGENYTTRMVTTNSTTFIFAGNRGRIYMTNGSNISLFKKIPDHVVLDYGGTPDLYFSWLDAIYWRNQLYFSFMPSTNAGSNLTSNGGLWSVDLSASSTGADTATALRLVNQLAVGTYGFPYVIIPNITTTLPGGAGLFLAYKEHLTNTYGLERTISTPYTSGVATIHTDLIPTGLNQSPKTYSKVEFRLAAPLVSGESITISARQNYSSTPGYTTVGTTSTAGMLSDVYDINFEGGGSSNSYNRDGQWIQLYIAMTSTGTTPSFVRLTELRLR